MAEMLKQELGADVELIEGNRGEFTVWVDEKLVARKGLFRFPPDKKVLSRVQQAMGSW